MPTVNRVAANLPAKGRRASAAWRVVSDVGDTVRVESDRSSQNDKEHDRIREKRAEVITPRPTDFHSNRIHRAGTKGRHEKVGVQTVYESRLGSPHNPTRGRHTNRSLQSGLL